MVSHFKGYTTILNKMIKKAVHENLGEIVQVLEEVKVHMLNKGIDQWDEEYPNRLILAQDIDNCEAFIYEDKGELLAYMTLNEKYDDEYNDLDWKTSSPFIVVHRLFVKPAAQGRGISSKMIEYVEQYASICSYRSIRLDAYSLNNTANVVYLKKGYAQVGEVYFRKGKFYCYEKAIEGS